MRQEAAIQLHDIIAIGTGQAPSGCDLLDWKKSKGTETAQGGCIL